MPKLPFQKPKLSFQMPELPFQKPELRFQMPKLSFVSNQVQGQGVLAPVYNRPLQEVDTYYDKVFLKLSLYFSGVGVSVIHYPLRYFCFGPPPPPFASYSY